MKGVFLFMNFLEMFSTIDQFEPIKEHVDGSTYEPTYVEQPPANWQNEFVAFKSRPVLYNMDGYISPYASNNWGGTSAILSSLDDSSRLPSLVEKVDPNKIFTSDISALRTLAADQIKIVKMFEKKLVEGLSDRGKVGLNENDIMAMQALTAARSAVTAINKEQIAIKKNIADLRIKQQQNSSAGSGATSGAASGRGPSTIDVGRSILDSIFDAPGTTMNTSNMNVPADSYQTSSLDDASKLLDDLIPGSAQAQFEAAGPKTYVVVGDSDDDVEYVTYAQNGEIMSDFPNPTSKITQIDRESGFATDELLVQYPIKPKND